MDTPGCGTTGRRKHVSGPRPVKRRLSPVHRRPRSSQAVTAAWSETRSDRRTINVRLQQAILPTVDSAPDMMFLFATPLDRCRFAALSPGRVRGDPVIGRRARSLAPRSRVVHVDIGGRSRAGLGSGPSRARLTVTLPRAPHHHGRLPRPDHKEPHHEMADGTFGRSSVGVELGDPQPPAGCGRASAYRRCRVRARPVGAESVPRSRWWCWLPARP
jgi:hypothetical protein